MKPIFRLFLAALLATASVPFPVHAEDHPEPSADPRLPSGSLYVLEADWTNQLGETVAWSQSTGTLRVVALGYANCKGVCPRIVADMQRIEKALNEEEAAKVRFTFVSLDPEHDKVEDMKNLGERHNVDDRRWDLLTGSEDSVLELAVALGIRYDRLPNGIDFAHSYLIAVLGPDGTLLHKWTKAGEGPDPSVTAIRKVLAE